MIEALVKVERRDGTTTLVLHRPERGNALGPELVAALSKAFEAALAQHARLIVFTGNGRNFCTGFDLADLDDLSDGDLLLRFVRVEALLQAVFASPVPTMAVAQGRVFGAGADLFAVCDHRIAVKGATFCFPGPGFGIVLGNRRLARRVGQDAARALLMSGRTLSAEDAVGMGLAQVAVDPGEVDALIADMAATAGRLDSSTVAAIRVATDVSDADRDLAALARSAAPDGLRDRIQAYRASVADRRQAAAAD